MELQKINVKILTAEPNKVPLTDFINIFHGWIQATDGVYHDVADYSHMQAGPGIVLVTGDANVSIDETGNRRGLLYSQKSNLSGSNLEKLSTVLRSALESCRRLEQEPALEGKLRFAGNDMEISVNDRLLAPNTRESFESVKSDLEGIAHELFHGVRFTLVHNENPRNLFSVAIRAAEPFALDQLIANVSAGAKNC